MTGENLTVCLSEPTSLTLFHWKYDTRNSRVIEIELEEDEAAKNDAIRLPENGCSLELTSLVVEPGRQAWWTVGCEAFGISLASRWPAPVPSCLLYWAFCAIILMFPPRPIHLPDRPVPFDHPPLLRDPILSLFPLSAKACALVSTLRKMCIPERKFHNETLA